MSLVWYAAYGSNMEKDRLMKYFNNEEFIVNGIAKQYDLCSDQSEPIDEKPYIINRRCFFAKTSGTWQGHGVSFISNKTDSRSHTYAKLYLISRVQFKHLFEQENNGKTCTIDYQLLQTDKKQDFTYRTGRLAGSEWFYGRILQLEDDHNGHPVLTFTTQEFPDKIRPMDQYVDLISDGIRATYTNISDEEIAKYIKKAKR